MVYTSHHNVKFVKMIKVKRANEGMVPLILSLVPTMIQNPDRTDHSPVTIMTKLSWFPA